MLKFATRKSRHEARQIVDFWGEKENFCKEKSWLLFVGKGIDPYAKKTQVTSYKSINVYIFWPRPGTIPGVLIEHRQMHKLQVMNQLM